MQLITRLSQGRIRKRGNTLLIHDVSLHFIALLNAPALLLTLFVNALANSLPLNGKTTGEISARIPSLFTPAPATFSIWGVIYLFLIAFVVYQLLPAQHTALFLERIGYAFSLSCVFNALWLVCWHYEQFALSFLVMLGLLASLLNIYRNLDIGQRRVPRQEFWCVNVPFSLYLGWISVATLANLTVVLHTLHFDSLGLPPTLFTLLLMLLAAGFGVNMLLKRNDSAYTLVIVWALVGIAARHQGTLALLAIPAALLACGLLIAVVLIRIDRHPELLNGIKTR